jgi:hypothetical protein
MKTGTRPCDKHTTVQHLAGLCLIARGGEYYGSLIHPYPASQAVLALDNLIRQWENFTPVEPAYDPDGFTTVEPGKYEHLDSVLAYMIWDCFVTYSFNPALFPDNMPDNTRASFLVDLAHIKLEIEKDILRHSINQS